MKKEKGNDIETEVLDILKKYLEHPSVEKMKSYIQHGNVTTYEHSLAVAIKCYEYSRKMRRVNTELVTVSAFLHDFYLYDWHESDPSHRWHGFHHAERAADNAVRIFDVPDEVREIILTHMWPLNITRIPTSREGWILTVVDKRVALRETLRGFFKMKNKEQA